MINVRLSFSSCLTLKLISFNSRGYIIQGVQMFWIHQVCLPLSPAKAWLRRNREDFCRQVWQVQSCDQSAGPTETRWPGD